MKPQAILALDPGKATGWACWIDGKYTAGETDFDDTCTLVREFVTIHGAAGMLIAESFTINANTPKNTQAPWSLELIGVFRMYTRTYMGRELVLQSPAMAKRFSSNNRLQHLGWWTKGSAGHANDAARHLLVYMATNGLLSQDSMRELVDIV